jgi:hypothetical protein
VLPAQTVEFNEEPEVRRFLERQARANLDPDRKLDVWRVQIAATVDRRQMEEARQAFVRRYGSYQLSTTYSEPYYKLRVGAYVQKRQAEAALQALKKDYPGAYLVRDRVKLSEVSD